VKTSQIPSSQTLEEHVEHFIFLVNPWSPPSHIDEDQFWQEVMNSAEEKREAAQPLQEEPEGQPLTEAHLREFRDMFKAQEKLIERIRHLRRTDGMRIPAEKWSAWST